MTTTKQPEAPESIQRRISALLERAAHPETPEHERALSQEKADALMLQYRINRATFNWEKPLNEKRVPTHRVFSRIELVSDATAHQRRRDFAEYSVQGTVSGIRYNCFRFAGVRVNEQYNPEVRQVQFTAVGYEEDIYYGDLIWNIAFAEILRKMYPGWDRSRSLDFNVYRLKAAGYSWPQVMSVALENEARDHRGPVTEKNAASKLRTAWKREAKRRGESTELPKVRDPHWWRRSFVSAFSSRLSQRMAALKAGREEYFTEKNLPALQQDSDAVDEAFYEMFPYLRPTPPEEAEEVEDKAPAKRRGRNPRVRYADDSAWEAGYEAANKVDLNNAASFAPSPESLP